MNKFLVVSLIVLFVVCLFFADTFALLGGL
jgi:hypothetical protein